MSTVVLIDKVSDITVTGPAPTAIRNKGCCFQCPYFPCTVVDFEMEYIFFLNEDNVGVLVYTQLIFYG